jgi:DeoR/GlpR family transcriptional regulator of sugar metabolism
MIYGAAVGRLDAVFACIAEAGFISIADLARSIGVSPMTVRRDVTRLVQEGRAVQMHGGVRIVKPPPENAFSQRHKTNWRAKDAIACAAAALVDPQDSVAIDAGSTALHLLDRMPTSFVGSIVSHSVPVMAAAMEQQRFRLVMLGGDLLRDSSALVGPLSVEAASRLRVRIFFLGAAAVDERGVYVRADIERPTKRALMAASDRVVLLADHTKFSSSAPVLLCKLDELSAIVTDQPVPTNIAAELAAANVVIHIAEPST